MRQESSNPPNNCLPPSIKESELHRAIERSGYPLQGIVADKLQSLFYVTEEWGYIDRDTKAHRSLDVFAHKFLTEQTESDVVPGLILLTECKRSVHPFVFFKNVTNQIIPRFPAIAGLPLGVVRIHQISSGRSLETDGAHAIGLDKHSFVEHGPPKCSAFSRATISGKKVELSGTELFNSLVLPLVNAFHHAYFLYKNDSDRLYPKLILSIGVLDAPMILVESPAQASDPVLIPWVRVVRQESVRESNSRHRFRYYGIDVVHIDYLDEFLSTHLMPFVEEFGNRSMKMAKILLHGGEVEDLDNWSWDQIREKVK